MIIKNVVLLLSKNNYKKNNNNNEEIFSNKSVITSENKDGKKYSSNISQIL